MKKKFWKKKKLEELNKDEWEALCDGCGKCCLIKLEDEKTGDIEYTNVACKLLSLKKCTCLKYKQRHKIVDDCVKLNYQNINKIKWMPKTCAYKLISEGKDLPKWHHLISGNNKSVHYSGNSVKGKIIRENESIELEK
ncbi:MAG: hypothetical protein CFH01_00052, partial [Alphaproteobacteria bacterium MarineAlpha2_Bin1]